ncbi:MAG: type II toxin-antitoxin system VapC family toxin [Desulfobacteraceae bacterium]
MVLVDTDVLIWYMRGNQKAKKVIDKEGAFYISSVNYMELVQGIRDKQELRSLRNFLTRKKIEIVHVSEEVSQKALSYMEEYSLSHNLRMADAMIAATALILGVTLLTANSKHYVPIKGIHIKQFRP